MDKDISLLAEEIKTDTDSILSQYADPIEETTLQPEEVNTTDTSPGVGRIATGIGVEVGGGLSSQAAGLALAPVTYGLSYPILSFSGGFLSNIAAQKIEKRDDISYGRAIFAGIVNLIPGASTAKGTAQGVGKTIAANVGKGVAIGAGDITSQKIIDEGRLPTAKELSLHGGVGGLFGGGFTSATIGAKTAIGKLSSKKISKSLGKVLGKTPDEIDKDIATNKITKADIINTSFETVDDDIASDIIDSQKRKVFANEVASLTEHTSSIKMEPSIAGFSSNKSNTIAELFPSRIIGPEATNIIRTSKQLVDSYEQIGNRINRKVKNYLNDAKLDIPEDEALGHINAFLAGGKLNDSISELGPDLVKFKETLRPLQLDLIKHISADSYTALPKNTRNALDTVIKESIDKDNYLTREYRLFLDKDFIPDMALRKGAASEIAKEMVADSVNETTGKASLKLSSALERANRHIDELIDESAKSRIDNPKGYVPRGIAGILKQKRDVGPKLREFLGEVTDPGERMLGTLSRVGRLVSSMEADNKLMDYLIKGGIANTERKTANQVKLNLRSIADSQVYIDPEIGHAINKLYINDPFNFLNDKMSKTLFDAYNTLVGSSKAAKVIFNPVSYAANAWGNLFSLFSSGIVPNKNNLLKGLKTSLTDFGYFEDAFTNKSNKLRKEFLDDIGEVTKYGIFNNNVVTSDVRNSLERGMFGDQFDKFMSPFGKAYNLADNMFRYVSWKANQKTFSKIFPNVNDDQLKSVSADITNNTYQNYSRVSESVKKLSRLGVLQQFFVFNAELMRNMYNQGRYIKKMFNGTLGDDFGIPADQVDLAAMKAEGARRLLGLTSVLGITGGGVAAYNMIGDVDKETEVAFKETLAPPWDSGKRLALNIDKDKGIATYFNPSYLIPHSIAISAFDAGFNDSPIKNLSDFVIDEFLGKGSFVFESASQAIMGIDDRGQTISPSETNMGQFMDRAKFFVDDLLQPGFIKESKKWKKALSGIGNYNEQQLALRLIGARKNNIDIRLSAKRKIKESADNMKLAKGNYSVARDYRNLSPEELNTIYNESNNYAQESFNIIRKHYNNLKNPSFGLSQNDIVNVMKDAGISSRDVLSIINGEYQPLLKNKVLDLSEIYEKSGNDSSDRLSKIKKLKKENPELARNLLRYHRNIRSNSYRHLSEEERLLFAMPPAERSDYLLERNITFRSPRYHELRRKGIIDSDTIKSMRIKYRN